MNYINNNDDESYKNKINIDDFDSCMNKTNNDDEEKKLMKVIIIIILIMIMIVTQLEVIITMMTV